MKKLVLASLAALSLGAFSGAALADAECQAGSAWGAKEGCGGPSPGTPQAYAPYYAPPSNSGWPPAEAAPYGYVYGQRAYAPQAVPVYPYAIPARPSRRDRDGDGVANRLDRYPDDPNRW